MANDDTPSTNLEGTTEVEQQLTELVDAHEQIAWDSVPTVSVSEAAAWTQRLQEARQEAAQSQRLVADGGTSRRQFMGAAAVLGASSLSVSAAAATDEDDANENSENSDDSPGGKLRPGVTFETSYSGDESKSGLEVRNIRSLEDFEEDLEAELAFYAGPVTMNVALDTEAMNHLIRAIKDDDSGLHWIQGYIDASMCGRYSECDLRLCALSPPGGEKIRVDFGKTTATVQLDEAQTEEFLEQLRDTLEEGDD